MMFACMYIHPSIHIYIISYYTTDTPKSTVANKYEEEILALRKELVMSNKSMRERELSATNQHTKFEGKLKEAGT